LGDQQLITVKTAIQGNEVISVGSLTGLNSHECKNYAEKDQATLISEPGHVFLELNLDFFGREKCGALALSFRFRDFAHYGSILM